MALNPAHTVMYPSPNNSTGSDTARSSRAERARAKRTSTGAADALIIPIIITVHITNARKTSLAPHDTPAAIPMLAIIDSDAADEDILRSI